MIQDAITIISTIALWQQVCWPTNAHLDLLNLSFIFILSVIVESFLSPNSYYIYIHNKKIKLLIFTFTLQFRIKRSWGKSNVWSTFSLAICKKCRTLGRPLINSWLDTAVRKVTLESIVRELNACNNICLIIFVPVAIAVS